jgi:hypothetical protein
MINEDLFSKLYSRIDRKKYLKGTTRQEVIDYFNLRTKNTLYCEYCKKELKTFDEPPYRDVVSIDRINPICNKGINKLNNYAITCCECNIVKGTMSLQTFLEMKECLENCGIKDKVFKEIWKGRLANKIKRETKGVGLFDFV